MRKLILYLVTFIDLIPILSYAQYPIDMKYDYTWVIGYNSSANHIFGNSILNFNGSTFDTSYNGAGVWYYATCASISDTAGILKYSTNGFAIYDTAFNKIPGGDSINCCTQVFTGNYNYGYTVTDGASLVKPNHLLDKYLLLHETAYITFDSVYSRTRLTTIKEEAGIPTVLSKNVNIINDTLWPASSELCRHANGKDWWMVRKHWKKNRFYVFLVDDNGVQLKSVQEFSGYIPPFHTQSVFSPDGSKFVIGATYNYVPDSVFVAKFYFDRCTGTLSNPQYHYWKLNEASLTGSGCAISPNSRFLYVSTLKIIFQFDLDASNWPATKTIVAEYDGFSDTINTNLVSSLFQWLQLGPDNRIYVTAGNTRYYHTIDNPNEAGTACNVNQHSFRLPTINGWSMPNFPNYRLGPIDGSPCDTLGIDNLTNINDKLDNNHEPVKIFPNPASDYITLFVPRITKQWQFALYDIQGREVLHVNSRGAFRSINISHLAQGIYLWKLVYEDGKVENGKMVKQ